LRRVLLPLLNEDETKLRVDALNGKLSVAGGELDESRLVAAVATTGMQASPWREESGGINCACCGEDAEPPSSSWRGKLREILTLASGLLMVAAFIAHLSARGWQAVLDGRQLPLAALLLYLGAVAAGFSQVLPRAWRSLRRLSPDMNLLMSLAVLGALILGEVFEAAMVSFLFAFSLLLESWSVGRARKAIARLMEIAPDEARVIEAGGEAMRPVATVALGARIRVHPGERIPLDGLVREGAAGVDQSPITGESQPVEKAVGDEVFAGCINGEGVLEIEVTHLARESTLARIMQQVEEAQGRRAAAERWVDRFARVYTPIMMGIALTIALLPPLLLGGGWERWFYQALVILVIACPCALVISTPVSVVAGLARAAREGVLIKGGVFLELPSRLAAMAFDKTGTLSRGKAQLEFVHCVPGVEENEVLAEAAALEARSGHPLAAAVLAAVRERGLVVSPADALKVIPGKGLQGEVAGRSRWIGSRRYMLELGREVDGLADEAAALEGEGHTLLLLADSVRVLGLISVRDGLRPEAPAALAELARLGVEKQVVLTGDHERVATALGVELRSGGADPEIRAELLPEDKSAAVAAIREAHGCVAMVGDGINDAPALATADIGIAMGVMGADAAIETADVALMSEDLGRLPWLVAHSRRVMGIIRQNIALALLIKAAFMVLAVTNVATLWMAIVADMGASLLVIGNGLRLLRAPGVDSRR
jgi:Zn2+/Cd2+-exporting ATPase